MRNAVVDVVSADAALDLEGFGDGVLELSAAGVEDCLCVAVWGEEVASGVGFGFQGVGEIAQQADVAGVVAHDVLRLL
ncbi:hypothetical protein [Streptomyces sp. NPDC101234]|uniref:hypothetical protein n=1 Tax=Streptomyces sp. NPDC101234 TaxID=3366138 RepID=UPI0037F52115